MKPTIASTSPTR